MRNLRYTVSTALNISFKLKLLVLTRLPLLPVLTRVKRQKIYSVVTMLAVSWTS